MRPSCPDVTCSYNECIVFLAGDKPTNLVRCNRLIKDDELTRHWGILLQRARRVNSSRNFKDYTQEASADALLVSELSS